jgi:hypothetical protein
VAPAEPGTVTPPCRMDAINASATAVVCSPSQAVASGADRLERIACTHAWSSSRDASGKELTPVPATPTRSVIVETGQTCDDYETFDEPLPGWAPVAGSRLRLRQAVRFGEA